MSKVLYNVRWPDGSPTIEDVCRKYGLASEEVDQQYGLIEIDPQDHLYCMLVEQAAVARLSQTWAQSGKPADIEGPYSNPPIEPFGPPQA